MFFETLRFSRIGRHQSCVPRFKSWRGWQVNVTLFFYTTQKQVLQIVPIFNESHEIWILGFRARLLHMCWPMHDGVQFSHILGGGKGVSPDSWQLAWKVTFVSVAGCQLHYDALEKNRMAKNCNIYPTSQYVVVTYFSSLRPCIQSWLEIINELDFKSDASDHQLLLAWF